MSKRMTSIILILVILLSFPIEIHAMENPKYNAEAEQLKLLGVFQETSSGFELDRQPTRIEGLVMFIRLLGVEISIVLDKNTVLIFYYLIDNESQL